MICPKLLTFLAIVVVCVATPSCTLTQQSGTAPALFKNGNANEDTDNLAADYQQLASKGGKIIRLQPALSKVRIYAFRGGRAAKLGHNHVLSAPDFEGFFYLPDTGTADSRFDLTFRLNRLAIDVPTQRAGLGPAFSAVLSDAAVADTREHMLGAANMQADIYPFVKIHSLNISGELPKFSANIAISLHGRTREILIPLTVSGLPQQLKVSGAFALRQTDFGIKPYSVFGGLLSVRDEVIVDFELMGS